MLTRKSITMTKAEGRDNKSEYICDMCKKELHKSQRILLATSDIGRDPLKKRYDLCEKCMKIIEKNISVWYDKIVNKK